MRKTSTVENVSRRLIDDLFPETLPKRTKPRVLMHVSDAGQVDSGKPEDMGKPLCKMVCRRCGAESDYMIFGTITAAKRGIPCKACNTLGSTS